MRNITLEEWDAAVRKVVAAHPDNVNPRETPTGSCLYFDGKRSCLIGHVLINEFNVPYNPDWEGKGATDVLADLNTRVHASPCYFPLEVMWAANNLQSHADYVEENNVMSEYQATTWREALTMHYSDDDNPY